MIKYVCVFLFSVFISSVSQIILKSRANETHKSGLREYLNAKVIIAYFIFFVSSLLTVFAYKNVPLSMGPILEVTGYIWVTVMGYFILKEHIGRKKLLGLALIVIDVVVFSMGSLKWTDEREINKEKLGLKVFVSLIKEIICYEVDMEDAMA